MKESIAQPAQNEWVGFPGGELEGKRPKALCAACRERLRRESATGMRRRRPMPLCFQCYRADLERLKALKAAGELDTASDARFQSALPFELVDVPRLQMLKAEHAAARTGGDRTIAQFVDRRRHAQIAARHALAAIASGLGARRAAPSDRERMLADAIHAAELQLPEAWLPFVINGR